MPYQKTKEGRLVNEVTLGDGYPLSNDKQPLKVGGEASIINVSSPTPDNSVDGEVEIKGNFKAKDTQVEGNFSATSIETQPQFRFHTRNNVSARVDVAASANQNAILRLKNNQGYFDIKREYSTTSLQFTDGTNTPLKLDGDNVEFTNLTDGSITIDSFVDEDDMSSNSATKIPTQQSVKAYVDANAGGSVSDANTTTKGIVELATTAETTTGTDTSRAVTPDGLKDGYQGSANVNTVGTIGTGTWQGTAIASAYLDADTAHLSVDQTITARKAFGNDVNLHLGAFDNNDYIYSDGNFINIAMDDTDTIQIRDAELRSEIPIKIQEAASAQADTAGKGQIWVKNDTPNNLYFTNDAGNDVQITNGSNIASSTQFRQLINAGFNYSYTAGTKVYIPLVGYNLERNSQFGANEFISYVAPYDGYLNQVVFRSEEACGSTVVGFHKSSTGTEHPNATASDSVTVDMSADDTSYKFAFTGGMSGTAHQFSAGDIINISFDPTNDANDVVFTAEFILDSSSGL